MEVQTCGSKDAGQPKALVSKEVVGAGGVEPPSSSVSDPTSLCQPVHRTGKDRKDHQKSAGEQGCQCPSHLTIRHGPPRVVLITTAVGCCPSAAPGRTEADHPHNNPYLSTLSQIADGKPQAWTHGVACGGGASMATDGDRNGWTSMSWRKCIWCQRSRRSHCTGSGRPHAASHN